MPRAPAPPAEREPIILRIQLELGLDRATAEALILAGFRTAAEIAAAKDEEFAAFVDLPARRREAVLALARSPGSKAPKAGEAPVSALEKPIHPAIVRAVGPVRRTLEKVRDEVTMKDGEPARGPKPAPPHLAPDAEKKRARKTAGEEAEEEFDAMLSGGR